KAQRAMRSIDSRTDKIERDEAEKRDEPADPNELLAALSEVDLEAPLRQAGCVSVQGVDSETLLNVRAEAASVNDAAGKLNTVLDGLLSVIDSELSARR